MKLNVELIAKKMFERFSESETGVKADWKYLSKQRQDVWIEDVYEIAKTIINELKNQVRPVPAPTGVNTSMAIGFNAGIQHERILFITILEELTKSLEEQILDRK